ncbi:hypothetical protein FZEAL_10227 [Fusarium zealandicum]|uniref:Cytochrome b561 domain-containing protein n=1 Tax=Fusarium zealandicum TaxID=1053134 RepID=A0A8H4XBW1_9HYPO|nr:hypothetical protein FZEAL_10227 [Fusarium zealandicum]
MASATGIPQRIPSHAELDGAASGETEPLLGRPGDAAQEDGVPMIKNLVLGTAGIAQLGIILLVVLVWASVLTKPLILFSYHPLLQSLAVLTLAQSILSLQPTHTAEQKRIGQRIHASLNLVAFLLLVAGVTIIEYNKISSNGDHFHSIHGYLGVTTSIVLLLQYAVGFTMWATPKLYGGEDNAKSIWKYHRWSGYFILVLLLATVVSAVDTDYNKNVLKLKLWSTLLLSIVTLAESTRFSNTSRLFIKTKHLSSTDDSRRTQLALISLLFATEPTMVRLTAVVGIMTLGMMPVLALAGPPDADKIHWVDESKRNGASLRTRDAPKRPTCVSRQCEDLADRLKNVMTDDENTDPCKDWDKYVCGRFSKSKMDRYKMDKHSQQANQTTLMKKENDEKVKLVVSRMFPWAFEKNPLQKPAGEIGEALKRIHNYHYDCMDIDNVRRPGFRPHDMLASLTMEAFAQYEAHWKPKRSHDPIPMIDVTEPIDVGDHDMMRNASYALSRYGVWAFAKFGAQQSIFDSSKMAIRVEPFLGPGLPYKNLYYDSEVEKIYKELIKDVLTKFNLKNWNYQSWEKVASHVFDLERQIVELAPSPGEWHNYQQWVKSTGSQLDEAIPELELSSVIKSQHLKDKKLPMDALEVLAPNFWGKLSHLLQEQSRATIRAYFVWQGYLQTHEYMEDKKIDKKYNKYIEKVWGIKPDQGRQNRCKENTKQNFPEIIGSIYVNETYSPKFKADGEVIADAIRKQYIKLLKETPWLSEKGKEAAINKAMTLSTMVGFQEVGPHYLKVDEVLEDYKDIKIGAKVWKYFNQKLWAHGQDQMNLRAFKVDKAWKRIGKAPNKYQWTLNPWDTWAAYSPQLNKVMAPAGMSWEPIYDPRLPSYVNYAGFGAYIAQQMSHAFDDVGFLISPNGTLDKWMPEEDQRKYDERAKCFLKKYDGIKVTTDEKKPKTLNVNGRLVLNNIIGDTQGTDMAYRAWKAEQGDKPDAALPGFAHLTNDQMFFLIRSYFHCSKQRPQALDMQVNLGPDAPPSVRVGKPLKDLESWNEAFQCEVPKKTCKLYGKKRSLKNKKVKWYKDDRTRSRQYPQDETPKKNHNKKVKKGQEKKKEKRGLAEEIYQFQGEELDDDEEEEYDYGEEDVIDSKGRKDNGEDENELGSEERKSMDELKALANKTGDAQEMKSKQKDKEKKSPFGKPPAVRKTRAKDRIWVGSKDMKNLDRLRWAKEAMEEREQMAKEDKEFRGKGWGFNKELLRGREELEEQGYEFLGY